MRKISHWTPRYLFHRVNRYRFEKKYPHSPNLAIGAIRFLESWFRKTDICLEYGAGRSTAWFAQRVHKMISVEDRRFWFEKVRSEITGYQNVELLLIEPTQNMVPGCGVSWDYVDKTKEFEPETFDFILNDGRARAYVGIQALPILKKGGILCWDDWAYTFPTSINIPGALPVDGSVRDKASLEFWAMVEDWRQILFDDGVHSTTIFFKPN
jgi:hypothetical protein